MMREQASEELPTQRLPAGMGFLWKFPSRHESLQNIPVQCPACEAAWITSPADLRRHADTCATRPRKFGSPWRVWCEISSTCLEWREDPEALQAAADQIAFGSVVRVTPLDDDCFQITSLGSTATFQASSRAERNAWVDALGEAIFLLGAPPGADATEAVAACLRDGGDIVELETILQSQAAAATYVDADGNSMVLVASKLGAGIDVFRLLLQYGADPGISNHMGEAPVLVLSAAGERAILALLLESGAVDVNRRYLHGTTAVHAAASAGETQALQLLASLGGNLLDVDDRGWSALHCASAYSYGLETVAWLCSAAPSLIDWPAADGNTSLHEALRLGLVDIAQTLLEHHASPRLSNAAGETAEGLARAMELWDLVALMPDPPENAWIECQTDEGDVFYYNSVTGESSWYRPGPPLPRDELGDTTPLCMLPVISPLQALDHPDAAAKELQRRKKERLQRRQRKKVLS
ncbi:hypothetical protein ACHHYP_15361 [Achlya hypogyna]|uniref:Uncharacterized protein n=1 Tax=Achlya hypogyna TaxID=1202772 RepID=A0A1V9YAZ5_ACHHY|nr:hypothetical protein ACHHYP_15361 [Achlya hypogyna]